MKRSATGCRSHTALLSRLPPSPGLGWCTGSRRGTSGRERRLASDAGELLDRSLLAGVEAMQSDVIFDNVQVLDLRIELPSVVAGVETNIELVKTMSDIHFMPINPSDNEKITGGKLALLLLDKTGARHVERSETLNVHVVLVVLDDVAAVVIGSGTVARRENDKRTASVRKLLTEAIREMDKHVVTRLERGRRGALTVKLRSDVSRRDSGRGAHTDIHGGAECRQRRHAKPGLTINEMMMSPRCLQQVDQARLQSQVSPSGQQEESPQKKRLGDGRPTSCESVRPCRKELIGGNALREDELENQKTTSWPGERQRISSVVLSPVSSRASTTKVQIY